MQVMEEKKFFVNEAAANDEMINVRPISASKKEVPESKSLSEEYNEKNYVQIEEKK
jgi:hypothetical protein